MSRAERRKGRVNGERRSQDENKKAHPHTKLETSHNETGVGFFLPLSGSWDMVEMLGRVQITSC